MCRSFPVNRSLSPFLALLLALMLLVTPLSWLVAMLVAAAFHEFCHYRAVRLCGGRIHSLRIAMTGAKMQTSQLSGFQTVFCVIAGPLGSLSLLFLARWFPRIAICGMIQGVYNLLPVYPMDGGRAIRCLLGGFLSVKHAERIASVLEYVCLAAIFLLGLYGSCVLRLGLYPVSGAVFMISRVYREKYLAKRS